MIDISAETVRPKKAVKVSDEQLMRILEVYSKLNFIDLTYKKDSIVSTTVDKDELRRLLKNIARPKNQERLRNISRALYLTSPQYRSLVNYYATLYNFDYVVEGYDLDPNSADKEKYKKAYFKSVEIFEKMNIKLESLKIRINAYLDGVFYGYARPNSNKSGFYIQQLNPDHCAITYINFETGLYGYSFDFSIFNNKEYLLDNYPDEFRVIYNKLKRSKTQDYWVRIESPNAICIKTVPGIHPVPPLIGLFEGILDIADFKALNKGNEEIGSYKILTHVIPMRDDKDAEPNDFLITEDMVQTFHNNIENSLPPQIALVTSPMKLEAIEFKKDAVERDKVAEANSQFWREAGVPELLFGNHNSSTALKYSIAANEAAASELVREVEKWINEYYKATHQKGSYKFRVRILETTKFNVKDYFDSRLKAAQFGLPVKNELVAILGMQPSSMYVNAFLENEVLELTDKLIPLSSSHTQSADDGGRPEKDDEELTEAGVLTRESGANME